MANLPDYIYEMAEYTPSIDVGLAILRDALPGIEVVSLLPDRADALPLVLVRDGVSSRVAPAYGLEIATLEIHVFTMDPPAHEAMAGAPSGEMQGALLSEAVRVAFRDAWVNKRIYPGIAAIAKTTQERRPRRVSDFATSAGPVQYADLPTGYWRYESEYRIAYRPLLNISSGS